MDKATRAERRDLSSQESVGFEVFFEAEYQRLFGTLCLVTTDRAEAEDITQEAFIRMWRKWERVEALESPAGYLYTTAFNVLRNRLRTTRRAVRAVIAPTVDADSSGAVDDRTTVLGALRGLPPRSRAAIVLTELLGYSSEEAGHILGIRASSARSLATHGRAELRRRLADTYE